MNPRNSYLPNNHFIRKRWLTSVTLAGYIFAQARNKNSKVEDKKAPEPSTVHVEDEKPETEVSSTPILDSTIYDEALFPSTIIEPDKTREPIPEDQQRELLKWILEEKRKMKPKSREEKKRLEEEKALLKRFIRADSIPEF